MTEHVSTTGRAGAVVDAYPMTMLQTGMVFHSEADPHSATYHDVLSVEVLGRWDRTAMVSSLDAISRRHDVMRTSFEFTTFDEPMQLLHEAADVPLEVDDVSDLAQGAQAESVRRWIEREKARPFHWSVPPYLRVQVHILGPAAFQLSMGFHHAILDGWSLAVLVREVLDTYRAALRGRALPLPSPPPFKAYVQLERDALGDTASRSFWAAVVGGAEPTVVPRLPRPSGARPSVAAVERVVDERVVAGLVGEARTLGVQLKTVLLAAHVRFLASVAPTPEVTTGLLVNGRIERALGDRALGLFLNTVPFRIGLSPGPWRDLIRGVHERERSIDRHRRYPLAQMLRDESRARLFETVFDFRHFHVLHDEDRGDETDAVQLGRSTFFEATDFVLSTIASIDPTSGSLRLRLAYDGRELTDNQVERFADHYDWLLRSIAAGPTCAHHTAGLLPRTAVDALVRTSSGPVVDLAADDTVEHRIERMAAAVPDALAVTDGSVELTYRELVTRASCVAERLVELGVGPESLVAALLPRTVDAVVALVGILRAGAAYVPLDASFPWRRLDTMLRASRADLVVTTRRLAPLLDEFTGDVLLVEDDDDDLAGAAARATVPDRPPLRRADGSSLAYVIFTSGSTGAPKGVQVSRTALVNLVDAARGQLRVDHTDRVVAITAFSFDIAALELFVPLTVGAAVYVAPSGADDTLAIVEVLRSWAPTLVQATPSTWRLLLETDWEGDDDLRAICGGEAMPQWLADDLRPFVGELWNAYGPTETTVWSSFARITSAAPRVTLGLPIANTQMRVLDDELVHVPEGVAGELLIGGAGLARGYLRQPGTTAERFVPDPYGAPGSRLYRTGDLVRRGGTGLEFLGRLDHQVKVRGFRIELGEIEQALCAQDGITGSVAVARRADQDDVVAYVVAAGRADSDELRRRLRTTLPEYMVPTSIVQLDALPLTPNGKVDRSALPGPLAPTRPRGGHVAPRDEVERVVAIAWEAVLHVTPVGVHDRFTDLGGHSLLALRLAMRLSRDLHHDVPVGALLEHDTVESLARAVRQSTLDRRGPLVAVGKDGALPPLFLAHPLGGNVFCYQELAAELGDDQPLIAFRAGVPSSPQEDEAHDIAGLASRYVTAMREVQPNGPYAIGGWCMGGTIAFEMARQLLDVGQEVRLLAIISSSVTAPVPEKYASDDATLLVEAFGGHLAVSADELRALPPEERVPFVLRRAGAVGAARPDIDDERAAYGMLRLFKRNAQALLDYRPEPIGADALVIVPSSRVTSERDAMGWRDLVGHGSRAVVVPGEHGTILEHPGVRLVAAALREGLA